MTTKYAIIVPDGAADEPLEQFGNKTVFEAAETPNMDKIRLIISGQVKTETTIINNPKLRQLGGFFTDYCRQLEAERCQYVRSTRL